MESKDFQHKQQVQQLQEALHQLQEQVQLMQTALSNASDTQANNLLLAAADHSSCIPQEQYDKDIRALKKEHQAAVEFKDNHIAHLTQSKNMDSKAVAKLESLLKKEMEEKELAMRMKAKAEKELAKGVEKLSAERERLRNQICVPAAPPSYWRCQANQIFGARRVPLLETSDEFKVIKSLMENLPVLNTSEQARGCLYADRIDKYSLVVAGIERIENAELWNAYCFEKSKLRAKYAEQTEAYFEELRSRGMTEAEIQFARNRQGLLQRSAISKQLKKHPMLTPCHDSPTDDQPLGEYWLYHGSLPTVIDKILTVSPGYDYRMGRGGLLGTGFYLADDPRKSNLYIPCAKCGKPFFGKKNRDNLCACGQLSLKSALGKLFDRSAKPAPEDDAPEAFILIYRAVLGNTAVVNKHLEDLKHPPIDPNLGIPHDSVMGESVQVDLGSPFLCREVVLYDRFQAYPEYIVRMERRPQASSFPPPSAINQALDAAKSFITSMFTSKNTRMA